jgi:hypothetical protein
VIRTTYSTLLTVDFFASREGFWFLLSTDSTDFTDYDSGLTDSCLYYKRSISLRGAKIVENHGTHGRHEKVNRLVRAFRVIPWLRLRRAVLQTFAFFAWREDC